MFEIICFIQISFLDLGNQTKTIMMIYNLLFICAITLIGLINLIAGLSNDEPGHTFWGLVILVTGVIAIVFQTTNL